MRKLSLFILLIALSCISTLAYDFEVDGIYYNIINKAKRTVEVSSAGRAKTVVIPSTVTHSGITYSVTKIGNEAFCGCDNLTSITIPNSVTEIGNKAFSSCDNLTSITIPNSVTKIGYGTFQYCKFKSVTIPNSITEIGSYAFHRCDLDSIAIPNSVTEIGNDAFSGCDKLTSITIPNSVTKIGYSAFSFCNNLTTVYFNADNCLTMKSEYYNTLSFHYSPIKNLIIGANVKRIPPYAFTECEGLTNVIIPDSVTEIGEAAFKDCKQLKSITIPNSITKIGKDAFEGCKSLTKVYITDLSAWCKIDFENYLANPLRDYLYLNGRGICNLVIPNDITEIKPWAFNGFDYLTSITIPNSVTKIGEGAFKGCDNIDSIVIPNSVTEIGNDAFSFCDNLTSITIPNSVTKIGNEAFYGCDKLQEVKISDLSTWCKIDFENYSANPLYYAKSLKLNGQEIYNLVIPNDITGIKPWAFNGFDYLTSITIPNSVTKIGEGAFEGCKKLTSIVIEDGNKNYDSRNNCNAIIEKSTNTLIVGCNNTKIPNSVTKIENKAFWLCDNLTSITIPNSVTEIGEKAFLGCKNLEYAIITNSKTHYYDYYYDNASFPKHTKIIRPKQELKSERDSYKWQYISYGDDKCGANAADGKEIVPAKYSEVEYIPNYEGYFLVRKNGCYAIYNPSGKIIIPISRNYSSIVKTRSDGRYYYRVCKSGKYGVCNIDGYEIVAPLYDNIIFSDGIFLYKDASGTWISLNKGLDRNNAVVENPTYTKRDVAYYDLALQQGRLEDSFGKKVRVEQVTSEGKRAFKIVFEDKILFEFGEYDLNSSALNYIDKVAETLNELPSTKVRITGYTDNVGSLTSNRRLSTQRANAVSEYLQQKGISASRIIAKGIPLADYVATNKTEEGRALNRRVEIVIEPK